MTTEFLKINPQEPEEILIERCAEIIKNGGSVVYPTETVYGLGVDVFNREACLKVFDIKERDRNKPLIVHMNDVNDVYKVAKNISENAIKLMKKYWPGALTIILEKSDLISDAVSQNKNVGIRIPNNKIELEIIKKAKTCITGTSANLSGKSSIVDPRLAYKELNGRVDIVIDGGVCEIGQPSTIIDMTGSGIKLLREGSIKFAEILKYLDL